MFVFYVCASRAIYFVLRYDCCRTYIRCRLFNACKIGIRAADTLLGVRVAVRKSFC